MEHAPSATGAWHRTHSSPPRPAPSQRAILRDWQNNLVSEVPARLLPKVAIMGRPNVGKSAVFNRVVGRDLAIVHDEAGVTRDRMYARADWNGREFCIVDTGGISNDASQLGPDGSKVLESLTDVPQARLPEAIERQAAAAAEVREGRCVRVGA